MNAIPETRYASTVDGLSIAYQTVGDGPTDIVLVPAIHCIDLMWEEPSFAHVLHRLARLGRLICLDYRGWGGSDPVPLGALPTPEAWMEDTRVVLDAVSSHSAHIVCHSATSFVGMLFSATYPERTETLTLIDASARSRRADDFPIGAPDHVVDRYVEWASAQWGTGGSATLDAPSRADDETFRLWSARFERGAASPATYRAMQRWAASLDVRSVLPSIRVPTLVLHHETGAAVPLAHGQYLAEQIPNAQLSTVPGSDFWFFTEHADEIVDQIEEFITGVPPERRPDRALTTIMFTDIVSSTALAAQLGDHEWTKILDRHDALVDRELERHRGRKVNPTGDGLLATFDGPARAVKCAEAICQAVRPLGIDVRAGLHTGEVELRGEDIGGLAVHIGQRISALAGAGEVLVSRTVTELVTGSDLTFEHRGDRPLKGVPGTWPVFALRS